MNNLFTPSELVLINGKEFIENLELDVNTLFHIEHNQALFKDKEPYPMFKKELYLLDRLTKVNAVELGTAIFVAAILANVWAGGINLEIKQRNFLFFHSTRLHSLPENNIVDWHPYTLEKFILRKTQIGAKWIDFIVSEWIEQNAGIIGSFDKSWEDTVKLVKKGMAKRQLLTTVQESYLGIFSHTEYKIPKNGTLPDTENLVEPILKQLKEYKQNNPNIWNLLLREILLGIKRSY